MEIVGKILFFAIFAIPLFFQILFGSNFIPVSRKMKFWLVCVISILLLCATYFICAKIMSHNMTQNGIKDGLPFVGLMLIEAFMAGVIVLTILIQISIRYFKNRKKASK